MYNFFKREEKIDILILFFSMFIASILEILSIGLIFPISGIILETINDDSSKYTNMFQEFFYLSQENLIFYSFLILITIYILKLLFLIWFSYYQARFIFLFKEKMSSNLFKNYLNQSFNYFYNRNSAEFLRNITDEVDYFSNYLLSFLRVSLESLVMIFTICLLFYLNPKIAIIIFLIFSSISFLYYFALKGKLSRWGKERQDNKKDTIQFAQEGFECLNYIKFLGKEDYFFKKFKNKNFGLALVSIKSTFVRELPRYIFEFIGILSIIIVFYSYFKQTTNITEIIQIITVYVAASFRILPSINKILNNAQLMKFATPSINTLTNEFNNFENFNNYNKADEPKINFNEIIKLKIDDFKFKETRDFSLKDINFEIIKNSKVGLVGKTGCGKSTIIQMIIGIIKDSEVKISIDGKNIDTQSRSWQDQICYVPQKIFVLDDTLKKNILFGKSEVDVSDEKILKLIHLTSLDKLVEDLPLGINTKIGEKGHNLSGGEIQRIAICRALLSDQQIIVLDEATSALDDQTANKILNHILTLKDKTVFVVTHKYQNLKKCDKVFSIESGNIHQLDLTKLN